MRRMACTREARQATEARSEPGVSFFPAAGTTKNKEERIRASTVKANPTQAAIVALLILRKGEGLKGRVESRRTAFAPKVVSKVEAKKTKEARMRNAPATLSIRPPPEESVSVSVMHPVAQEAGGVGGGEGHLSSPDSPQIPACDRKGDVDSETSPL